MGEERENESKRVRHRERKREREREREREVGGEEMEVGIVLIFKRQDNACPASRLDTRSSRGRSRFV